MKKLLIALALLFSTVAIAGDVVEKLTKNSKGELVASFKGGSNEPIVGGECTASSHNVCSGSFIIPAADILNNSGWTSFDSDGKINYMKVGDTVSLAFEYNGTTGTGRKRANFQLNAASWPSWIKPEIVGQGAGTNCLNHDTSPGSIASCGGVFVSTVDRITIETNVGEAITNRQVWGSITYSLR